MSDRLSSLFSQGTFYDVFFSDKLYAQFYNGSGYANFGYWPLGIDNAADAGDALVDLVLAPVNDFSGKILDVACGHGASTKRLCRYFEPHSITAIGMDGTQVAAAKRRAPDCNFRRMNATQLTFKDETFDVVMCVEAAFHFDTREAFLQEALRVLKPGGKLIVADLLMAPGAPLTPPKNYLDSTEDYRALLSNVGFLDATVTDVTTDTWEMFRRRFNAFATALPSRAFSLAGIRNMFTVNVNSSWAIRTYVVASATRPH